MNCPHCKDTGDTGSGYLDCFHCDAAQIIAAHEARKSMESAMTTTNEQMLKDCPICGCAARFEHGGEMASGGRTVKVRCAVGCIEQVIFFCTEEQAAASWNGRAALRESAPAPQELTDEQQWNRWLGDRSGGSVQAKEAFMAAMALSRSTAPQEAAPVEQQEQAAQPMTDAELHSTACDLYDELRNDPSFEMTCMDGTPNIVGAIKAVLSRHPAQPVSAPVAWISVEDRLPEDETPVLIMYKGEIKIGEIRWERPGYEETFIPFQYWDDPENDGQDWDFDLVTHWMPLPPAPGVATQVSQDDLKQQNAELVKALKEMRRAIGTHYAPNDCYATGPITGNEFRDLVECPACSAIAMYDEVIASAHQENNPAAKGDV